MENKQFVDELRFVTASLLNKNQNILGVGEVLSSASIIWTLFRYYMSINLKENEREFNDEFIFGSFDFAGGLIALDSVIKGRDLLQANNLQLSKHFIKNDFNCSIYSSDCESVCTAFGKSVAYFHRLAKMGVDENLFNKRYFMVINYNDIISGKCVEILKKAYELKISNMIILVDYTGCTMERVLGEGALTNLAKIYESLNVNISVVENGNDCDEIRCAIEKAKQGENNNIIFVKTSVGYASKFENKPQAYLQKLDELGLIKIKEKLNLHNLGLEFTTDFLQGLNEILKEKTQSKISKENALNLDKLIKKSCEKNKENTKMLAKVWNEIVFNGDLSPMEASNAIMGKLASVGVDFVGGGACNVPLTWGFVANSKFMCANDYTAQNIHFDDCKNSAGFIINGLSANGCRAFYCDKLVNMQQISASILRASFHKLANLYVWTHDGFAWKLANMENYTATAINELRASKSGLVFRPCDANEVKAGYAIALSQTDENMHLVLASQPLPCVCKDYNLAKFGGYELISSGNRKHNITLIASGTEVGYVIKLQEKLNKLGYFTSVVSMPCEALFAKQGEKYQKSVFGKAEVRVFIEFSNHNIYLRYARDNDIIVGFYDVNANKSGVEAMEDNACDYQAIIAKIEQSMKKFKRSNAILFG